MRQAGDERTFHIFYQMLNGMDTAAKKEYLVQDAKSYKFLSNGNLPVPGVNDGQEFEDTCEAMNIMGMSEDEQSGEQSCLFICCCFCFVVFSVTDILRVISNQTVGCMYIVVWHKWCVW